MAQILISGKDFNEIRRKIRENKGKEIVFSSPDDELNKKIMEKENINILLPVLSGRKDKSKQRDSGFNQVLAKIAKKKNVTLGIDLDEISTSSGKEKAEILARVSQNIKMCNKNKVKMKFISKGQKDQYDLKSLGLALGMPTWMAKEL